MNGIHSGKLVPYRKFTDFTPTLPKFYWDVYSQEERLRHICLEICKMIDYADAARKDINLTHDDVDKLAETFDRFMESGFEDYYADQIEQWVSVHFKDIVESALETVFFGLTEDGYFCAYTPKQWEGISFDTPISYERDDYGKLVIVY